MGQAERHDPVLLMIFKAGLTEDVLQEVQFDAERVQVRQVEEQARQVKDPPS